MPYNILGDIQTLTLAPSAHMDNPCCILTLDNSVQLMGNVELEGYEAGAAFATLPESMRPMATIIVPVYVDKGVNATDAVMIYAALDIEAELPTLSLQPLTITPDGEIGIPISVANGTVYLNGLEFGAYDRYYNSEIGNNFYQGTAPLRWDGSDW